jgi:signal transduction histidine kinase/CheY-like chemotaxis protein
VTRGDLTRSIQVEARGEVSDLKDNINQMIANLRETTQKNVEQDWLKTNLARLSGMLQGQRDLKQVTQLIMSEVTPVVGAQHGAFFLAEPTGPAGETELRLISGYGYRKSEGTPDRLGLGEGLVGQCAVEGRPITLHDVPGDYVKVSSGLGDAPPRSIVVMPVLFEEQVLGVIELASLQPPSQINRAFLDQITETIGVVINTIQANMRTEELLAQSQSLTRELQRQSEELRQTNDELQEKAVLLSQQNRDIEIKNAEIERARAGLEEKAAQLALSSKYKSEFLANMSHELRTPLNSLLILSRLLGENQEGNLTPQQAEFAQTIHSAGTDLLALINDILDLSKVEAGKMELNLGQVALSDVCDDVERSFDPMAKEKSLGWTIELDEALPASVVTDEQRLQQVLRNLLSNAFKFTHAGDVTLRIQRQAGDVIAFTVADTGVGIPQDKLASIFEAFQQADGTTSRKYGGTGLGLSISREIARLLGGEIHADSQPGEGSTFSLLLPLSMRAGDAAVEPAEPPVAAAPEVSADPATLLPIDTIQDDRGAIAPGDRVVLVITHDADSARSALAATRERGFKGLVARRTPIGLALAREFRPDAIVVFAGDARGEVLLGQLKQHPETRHRPVYVGGPAGGRLSALRAGAAGYFPDPGGAEAVYRALDDLDRRTGRTVKRLAVIQEEDGLDPATMTLLGAGDDVDVVTLGAAEAASALRTDPVDCAVVVLHRAATWALPLLEAIAGDDVLRDTPIVLSSGDPLSKEERTRVERLGDTLVLKQVSSPERLVDETALFLHRIEARLPKATRRLLAQLRTADSVFQGKRVLIVDDDIRNVFALASALEMRGMKVGFAENGREGIDKLREQPNVDLVLLDVMMPEMDGYETARAIRSMPKFETLPIISLTAKAMKGDRDKSISAGASDYITKPVDIDQLLSLMRVWLHR